MLSYIIQYSLKNKLIILLLTGGVVAFGTYALVNIPIGAVPDVTNNQVQVITTSRDLSTQDIEQFITYPVELEMANLPGVKEIRSISKFGLSVVTIVFEDRLGTFLPRQLIAEKIKTASERIPQGFGTPEMGPITTGLGEIYQYVLEVDPQFEDRYSIMDLRTIQDWIVKRQLSGIPGVVEVNTWGGYLKQYEVCLNPQKLRAMNLTVSEVFESLEKNNSVAGGGYIEKDQEAYFIRGEGLTKDIKDIKNIVVETRGNLPIYVKDVAEVGLGYATRFGAITANAEGEKVLGQVMMLKHANSKEVIEAVKARVEEMAPSLPEGISINPFLERSELIGKTTRTVAENLILGCLIVIFVVVLLLGNLRSGLVVASIIPLSLLFAISLMYLFGVDANLMSLGAIDFGIIIDGAVIIVEYIAFTISSKTRQLLAVSAHERQGLINEITRKSATKMMHSAVFGQLIIIIVFIPILSLVNVEGKMFRPMALTFSFALIGAMILCFTYVPVVSSLFLKPSAESDKNISTRLISWLQGRYRPILRWALQHHRWVMGVAVALLLFTTVLFSRLGGEFVPTLDEGDFVIQPVLATGTSLSRTIEITTDIEKVIKSFPEVDQVVTRIGAAEVPTDPMSMEETDIIITLIPKSQWRPIRSKDELANEIKSALIQAMPGVDYEVTQPIEMRFNELITGVRADLAIKVFGEDLNQLVRLADQIQSLIEGVQGASDIVVEKIEGLPQMSVHYNRAKMARYGLNIQEVNDIISMGFAGKVAGSVFEGEKRFDLVTRFDKQSRQDIEDIENTFVTTPIGQQVPLSELASITFTEGPAKISRDDTRRRIVVSVNVRNRDLESVVDEVRGLIEQNMSLPPGYYVSYGGQFENLESARQRLNYAVPVALILIFVMLHFAFRSIREALLIYTAIPLAAVGGVFFLWIRGLPFSISAGVGFIALFGIAVLNGIVLIGEYKELREESFQDLKEMVIQGTLSRLRPVLLTATAASLGFLPMAISTSAGAEVQRPLATVVIGGLITATILTLLVLPVLYYLIKKKTVKVLTPKAALLILVMLPITAFTQSKPLTLERAIAIAKENNAQLHAQRLAIDRQEALKVAGYGFENTEVYYSFDEANIAPNDAPLRVWGIQQSFQFPLYYARQSKLNAEMIVSQQHRYRAKEWTLMRNVSMAYYDVLYRLNLDRKYQLLDSIYGKLSHAARRSYELGGSNLLEKLTSESQRNEIELQLRQNQKDLNIAFAELAKWMQSDTVSLWQIPFEPLRPLRITDQDSMSNPGLSQMEQQNRMVAKQWEVQKSLWLPDVTLEYFQGANDAENAATFSGFQVGLGFPILYGTQRSKMDALKIEQQQTSLELTNYSYQLTQKRKQLHLELVKYQQALDYFDQTGKELSESLIQMGGRAFANGEIDFYQYIQVLERGIRTQIDYLTNLNSYNQTVLSLNYLID